MKDYKQLGTNLSTEQYSLLQELKKLTNVSMAELLRNFISTQTLAKAIKFVEQSATLQVDDAHYELQNKLHLLRFFDIIE